MISIRFAASPKGRFAKAGEKGLNTTLEEIKEVSKSIATRHNLQGVADWATFKTTEAFEKYKAALPSVQMFDCDYRVSNANLDWNLWNGCVYVDIDSKKYNGDKEFDVNEVGKLLISRLECAWPEYFYAFQVSASRNSYHIIFYFNVEKNEINFNKCAKYAFEMVGDAFHRIGRDDIWGCKGVADAASQSAVQLMQMSPYPIFYNSHIPNNFGEWRGIDEYYNEISPLDQTPDITPYEIVDLNLGNKMWDIDHNERFYLYTVFKRITSSEAECNNYWAEFCKHIVCKKPKHSPEYFTTQFQSQYESIAADKAKLSLLSKYGIVIDKSKERYFLNENEFMGHKIGEIIKNLPSGCTLLQAGTGVGKTRTWIDYSGAIYDDKCRVKTEKPILVIEPLNSIIESKYKHLSKQGRVKIVTGSSQDRFPANIKDFDFYVTNYNMVLDCSDGECRVRPDCKEFFGQFQFVVIDESHMLMKDRFRASAILPLVQSVNIAGDSTKFILQTATPMDEELFFNIKKHVILYKPTDKKIKFIFRNFKGGKRFELEEVICLAKWYRDHGRKVYIYKNNASLDDLKKFRKAWFEPERVAIVQKRNKGERSQKYVLDECHEMGDQYDVLLSSVYFGVGNDLNDTDNAAVILISNNSWQEDIQAIGRFRNSSDIEVCQINMACDREFLEATKDRVNDLSYYIKKENAHLSKRVHDKLVRGYSLAAIGLDGLNSQDDAFKGAIMKANLIYNSQFRIKKQMLSDGFYGIEFDDRLDKDLECDYDYVDSNKEYNEKRKAIHNEAIRAIVSGALTSEERNKLVDEVITKNRKLNDWYKKVWLKINRFNLQREVPIDFVANLNNYNVMKYWAHNYEMLRNPAITDFAEIYSLLKATELINGAGKGETGMIGDQELPIKDYYTICMYVVWCIYKRKGSEDTKVILNYFSDFRDALNKFLKMPNELIELLLSANVSRIEYDHGLDWFMDYIEMDKGHKYTIDEIFEKTCMMDVSNEEKASIMSKCLAFYTKDGVKAVRGVLGGRPSKQIVIDESFPTMKLVNYGLSVGDVFESVTALAEKIGIDRTMISKWRKKGWIR